MVLKRLAALLALWMLAISLAVSPASAHMKKQQDPAAAVAQQRSASPQVTMAMPNPGAGQDRGAMMDEMMKDRSNMTTLERLLDWLGRLHPMIIHFPLAFFPAALFTAIVGRRRPAFTKPVQFLVVAGGITAPIAMVLGWLYGGLILTDSDPLLGVHRWLGTLVGFAGFGLAIWAWRQPEEDRGSPMVAALAVITAAIIVQGWFGGALVHGMDHMNW